MLVFGPGLNVIYGASNTGKSFVVDSIDFMLGGRGPLRDMPERVGFDRAALAFQTLSGEEFTVVRSIEGGSFVLHDGLHSDKLPAEGGRELLDQHSEKNEHNLSSFLLSKCGLANRKLRRNKQGDVQNLSFRNIARLLIVNEEEIIQQRSPLSDGNYSADTANAAVFKLLLTGVDDSSLVAARASGTHDASRGAQVDLLEQLIRDHKSRIKDLAGPASQLEAQLTRLDETMAGQSEQLATTEAEYKALSTRRREALRQLEDATNRLTEIGAIIERFAALDEHYASDIRRLSAIAEAGSLFLALGPVACPLCGAPPEHHRSSKDCAGDVDSIVAAATAEMAKIDVRKRELSSTVASLQREAKSFERRLPNIRSKTSEISNQIEKYVAPILRQQRGHYSELAERRAEVREALSLYETLRDLEQRKSSLETQLTASGTNTTEVELSASTVDEFAMMVLAILKEWEFPHADRAHFDLKTRDLVISGKHRISFGKGLRAVTHAAFTVGLMEFCRKHETPHPGFVVLDSPLLSYREPDSQDDDLRATHLNERFYSYLHKLSPLSRQFLIVENTDPPNSIQGSPQAVHFSGNSEIGRFGLFPIRRAGASSGK